MSIPQLYVDRLITGPVNGFYPNPLSRPKEATDDMVTVAEAVVDALMASGHMCGWGGDRSLEFKATAVVDLLNHFVDFAYSGKRIHPNYVRNNASNMDMYSSVGAAIINQYARYLGYSITWKAIEHPYVVSVEELPKASL